MKISGTVVNKTDQTPVATALVTLLVGEREIATLATDQMGHFEHSDTTDQYIGHVLTCRLTKGGFLPGEISLEVQDNDLAVQIALSPEKPPSEAVPEETEAVTPWLTRRMMVVVGAAVLILGVGIAVWRLIPKNFLPPQTYGVVVLDIKDQKQKPKIPGVDLKELKRSPYRYFEVYSGGARIGKRLLTDEPRQKDLPEIAIPGKKLSVHFFNHAREKHPAATAEVDVSKRWTVAKAIRTLGAKTDKGRQVWKVALSLNDREGKQYYYWVGLRPLRTVDARFRDKDGPYRRQ